MDGQRRSGRNRASWRAECPTSLSPIMWIDHRAFGENLERRRCTGHSDVEVLGVHQVSLRDDHMVVLQALSEQGGTDDVGRGTSTPTACALSDLGRGAACRHAAAVLGADDFQLYVVPKLLSFDHASPLGADGDHEVGTAPAPPP